MDQRWGKGQDEMVNGEVPLTDAGFWDDVWRSSRPIERIDQEHPYFGKSGIFIQMVRRVLPDISTKRILEIGGGGPNYRLLALRKWCGAQVTAIDYSPVGLDLLYKCFDVNGVDVECIEGDIFNLAVRRREKYDAVVHWGVVEHFENPREIIRISAEMLESNGRLLFSMPNMMSLAARFWARYSPDNFAKHCFHSDEIIQEAMTVAGLLNGRCFHFGYPAVQFARWEQRSMLTFLLSVTNRAVKANYRFLPLPSVKSPRLATERGFSAEKSVICSADKYRDVTGSERSQG